MRADTWTRSKLERAPAATAEGAPGATAEGAPAATAEGARGFSRASWLFRCEVALARARRQIGIAKTHGEIVHLAVEFVRREAERVLMMQFVGDAREGRDERRRRFQ